MTPHERLFALLDRRPVDRTPMWLLFPWRRVPYYADVRGEASYAAVQQAAEQRCITLDRCHLDAPLWRAEVVSRADVPNLGLGLDSFHLFATETPLDDLELLDPEKIFLVQLADYMWQEIRSVEERITTARHFRVFPGEGVHSEALADLVRRLHALGYRGDYSFEVFNDDYQQMPLPVVAQRARRSALWLGEDVLRRSVPLPNQMRLRARAGAR